jgi:hypothetical protein
VEYHYKIWYSSTYLQTCDAYACQFVHEGKPSAHLPVISGVRQGFFLSPRIFLMTMGSNEEVWRHAQEKPVEVQIKLQKWM